MVRKHQEGQGKQAALVQKNSAMNDTYVWRGVEINKNVPQTVILEY